MIKCEMCFIEGNFSYHSMAQIECPINLSPRGPKTIASLQKSTNYPNNQRGTPSKFQPNS